jgi:protein O-GlcNAc transferase
MSRSDPAQVDAMISLGWLREAEAALRAHLAIVPADVPMVQKMGLVLMNLARAGEAAEFFDRAAGDAAAANDADFWANYGTILPDAGRRDDAVRAYERALTINPTHFGALVGLAGVLREASRLVEAEPIARRGVEAFPNRWEPVANLSSVLLGAGRPDESVRAVRDAIARQPEAARRAFETDLLPNLLMAMNYTAAISPAEAAEAHATWGKSLNITPPPLRSFLNSRQPGKRLKVALVSPDLRAHSVSFFVEALLTHRDPAEIETVCVFTGAKADETTARLKSKSDVWIDAAAMDDPTLIKRLRTDKVDIAIELSGHTLGERLRVFAKRAAPVQITYCGYPNTTGVPAIDYRIVDAVTDPEGAERLAGEALLRLDPCFLCYTPAADLPEIDAGIAPGSDSTSNAPVRFGSFNAMAKITPACIDAWARILCDTPGTTMLIKNGSLADAGLRARLASEFVARGVDATRLEMLAWTPSPREGLALYNQVDIALDSFPYTGTTTTCEALVMGVPVVTLRGSAHAARVSASLIAAAGLADESPSRGGGSEPGSGLIAESVERYHDIACALARAGRRAVDARHAQRTRVLASALCDGPKFCRGFERALRGVWAKFCAG